MERSKKLKIIQISLLISGLIIILFTYVIDNQISKKEISTLKVDKIIDKSLEENQDKIDIFYDIEYVGLDLSGNRYILKSKEAYTDKFLKDTINFISIIRGRLLLQGTFVITQQRLQLRGDVCRYRDVAITRRHLMLQGDVCRNKGTLAITKIGLI